MNLEEGLSCLQQWRDAHADGPERLAELKIGLVTEDGADYYIQPWHWDGEPDEPFHQRSSFQSWLEELT